MANKSYHELTDKEWKMVEKIAGGAKNGTPANKSSHRFQWHFVYIKKWSYAAILA